jgi:branched-chain amino acid transport system ATP-binding protein
MAPLLKVDELAVAHGGVQAVDRVSIELSRGQFVGLIGPNGAGKTTLIDAITGFTPSTGSMSFDGTQIARMTPHQRARLGLTRTWQSLELFDELTVREHVLLAAEAVTTSWKSRRDRKRPSAMADWALETVGLVDVAERSPRELAHGRRKLVGVARALAGKPKVILLDEPAAGLNTAESQLLGRQLQRVAGEGVGLLLVDHDVQLVAAVCEYLYALDFGRLIAEGPCRDVLRAPEVVTAFLGEEGAAAGQQAVEALESQS